MVRSTTPSLVNGKVAQRWPRDRRLQDPGQFTGYTAQPGLGMVTVLPSAAAWRRSSGLAAPPNAADHRSECARAGFDPLHGAGHRADRLGEQTRIDRIRHISGHNGGVARTCRCAAASRRPPWPAPPNSTLGSASSPRWVVISSSGRVRYRSRTETGKTVAGEWNRPPPGHNDSWPSPHRNFRNINRR